MTALSTFPASPVRLLLVEHEAGVQDLLHALLTSEGYAVSLAPAPSEALALVSEHTFHLILTDLFKGHPLEQFSSIEPLRAEAHPTPVAVITGWNITEEAIKQRGFAGLIRKPFDLDELLASIAAYLPTPLSPEHACQAQIVQAYFAALNARDWQALAALCTDDVTHRLPEDLPLAATISGKAAFVTYVQAALTRVPCIAYEEVLVAPDAHGLAARACSLWRGQADNLQRQTSTLQFRFQGERICQIRVQPGSGERFTRLLTQLPRPLPQTNTGPRQAARVLLVEADALLRASLVQMLTQAGYQVSSVSALTEALSLLKERCFDLILADLFAGPSLHGLAEAQLLRRNARPTPVGLLTNQRMDPGEVTSGDFAFLVSKSVEQEHLLWLIATTLQQPMSRTQERQADLVRRLFAAINAADWEQLTTLCTDGLRFYPPPGSQFHSVKVLHGVRAYQAQLEAVKCRFPDYRLDDVVCFAHPKGVAVRYQASWRLPDGRTQAHTGATLFGFQGDRIAQIAAWANTVTLLPLQTDAERSSA